MIYNVTSLPAIFHVEQNCIQDLPQILDSHGISANRILLLTGKSHSAELAARMKSDLAGKPAIWTVNSYSEAEVKGLREILDASKTTLLIAVGGGGVIDVTKRVSKVYGIPCLVVPTVVSNDGLMSPISVLQTDGRRFQSLPAAMPIGVIADLTVLMGAPPRYLRAAGGDLLSNLSATSDWRFIVSHGNGPRMNDAAFHLARNSAESLVHSSNFDLNNPRFVRSLVVAQIYSGIAMTIAGTSRPCSGPEHLVSHALDELGLTPTVLHGTQVGSVCLFMLYLLGELSHEVTRFAQAMEIPPIWTDLSPEIAERLDEVLTRAREVRPDRHTILDSMSNEHITKQLELFSSWSQPKLRGKALNKAIAR